jgi:hypothetical protein
VDDGCKFYSEKMDGSSTCACGRAIFEKHQNLMSIGLEPQFLYDRRRLIEDLKIEDDR